MHTWHILVLFELRQFSKFFIFYNLFLKRMQVILCSWPLTLTDHVESWLWFKQCNRFGKLLSCFLSQKYSDASIPLCSAVPQVVPFRDTVLKHRTKDLRNVSYFEIKIQRVIKLKHWLTLLPFLSTASPFTFHETMSGLVCWSRIRIPGRRSEPLKC